MMKMGDPGPGLFCEHLHYVLSKVLEERQTTLTELAPLAGLHPSLLTKWLKGDRKPDAEHFHSLEQAGIITEEQGALLAFAIDLDKVPKSVHQAVHKNLAPLEQLLDALEAKPDVLEEYVKLGSAETGFVSVSIRDLHQQAKDSSDHMRAMFPRPITRKTLRRGSLGQRDTAQVKWTADAAPSRQNELTAQLSAVAGIPEKYLRAFVVSLQQAGGDE